MMHHDPQKAIRFAHMIAKHLMRGGYADGGDPTPDDDADYAAAVAAGQNADASDARPLTIYANKPDTSRATVEGADMPPQPVGGNDVVDRALKASAQPIENKSYRGSILPFSRDAEGSLHFDPTAGILGSLYSGAMLPGDVYAGRVNPMSDEGIQRAQDLAGLAMTGGIGGAEAKAGETVLGSGPVRRALNLTSESPNPDFLPTALAKAAHYSPELAMAGMGTFKHPISGTKLVTPIEEMRPVFDAPDQAITPRKPMDWSATEGGVYMPATWDRSRGDQSVLKEINGQKLTNPQVMEGGPLYMNWGDLQPEKQVAASGADIIDRMASTASEAKKIAGDKDVYLANVLMGLEGADFSHMVANPLVDLARQRGFSKTEAEMVDDAIRKSIVQSLPSKAPIDKKTAYANQWPGIMHPDLDQLIWKMGGPYRSSIAKAFDTKPMKDLGVPDVASIRYAATQPELLNSPNLSTGFSIAKVNPGAPAVSSGHTTYPVGLPGLGYVGGSQTDIPFKMFWRDFMKTRPEGENLSHTQRAFTMKIPVQKADPEWVDTISNYERNVQRGLIPP